ncbi:potassium transporter Kup [Salmonella enterica]|uniref:potassium transporter Kup n=1 Tax=Salmonella enterica TaxID=28901 RepID=UPI001C44D3F8|nr:KUP/HAK/KT family potassium transporter [Salmonella enterica]EEP8432771.1 KUP/HAK/KT family potassium transporter [Salmonella enterica subsp. salamae]ELI6866309.1 KUP/HAK/KT family potassium transporter [Salmonella enterica]HCL5292079.1 KUP/HAK/KT family potassium transporter [Salmonella enterica]
MAEYKGNDLPTSKHLPALAFCALGIVFGDIGTSPLYTMKTVLVLAGNPHVATEILGLLSLIFWTMVIITSLKYALCVMRLDNHGEGGILALMSLLGCYKRSRPVIVIAALFGAALIYSDGAITPAISVLSALEGVKLVMPQLSRYILPAAVVILLLLFALQHLGTAKISKLFSPIMMLWFLCIALLGIRGILLYPDVLSALNPLYAVTYLLRHGIINFAVLSGVFLCVTGAEALYADMGHFGSKPIRFAWFCIVFPSLLLNYAGQTAMVLSGVNYSQNIFYLLCPPPLLIPLVILATLATIIASQAVISGAFSMTRQAIQLNWLPRLQVLQTTKESYGQIYIGSINFMLMFATLLLAIFFKTSESLASAYGVAVSLAMALTSSLLFISMREIWKWPFPVSLLTAGFFLCTDLLFLCANLTKLIDGGYIPLLLAIIIFTLMQIWHKGSNIVHRKTQDSMISLTGFMHSLKEQAIPRIPGTAVFLSRTVTGVPSVMRLHVERNGSLHNNVLLLTILIDDVPYVASKNRLTLLQKASGLWCCSAHYGFMEHPNIPQLLSGAEFERCQMNFKKMTYYIGHESLMLKKRNNVFPAWQRKIFRIMLRNSAHVTDYYYLPSNLVVEINRVVAL